MSEQVHLRHNYIQIVRQSTGETTYGGDQGFFNTEKAGSIDARKNQLGCGVVALTDTVLYLKHREMKNPLSQAEYEDCFNKIYDWIGGLSAKVGANGLQLATGFNQLARRNGWKLSSSWGLSASKIYTRMREMLQRDIPVILCIPMMLRKKDKEKGITFFQREAAGFGKATTVNAHFVVVTGIVTEAEEEYLQISSWGKKYFIRWKEYEQLIHHVFGGTILGNILYIK